MHTNGRLLLTKLSFAGIMLMKSLVLTRRPTTSTLVLKIMSSLLIR